MILKFAIIELKEAFLQRGLHIDTRKAESPRFPSMTESSLCVHIPLVCAADDLTNLILEVLVKTVENLLQVHTYNKRDKGGVRRTDRAEGIIIDGVG